MMSGDEILGYGTMVGMLDYHLHYALMAAEDRVRDAVRARRAGRPLRPRRAIRIRRDRGADERE
jgi:hypothetical protein